MSTTRWKPSATVAAVIGREVGGVTEFLLVEEHTQDGLRLNNPAGHLDPGESPIEGCAREALEETAFQGRCPEFGLRLAQHQQAHSNPFTTEQQHWLEMIRDHIAANLGIEIDDFEYAPFNAQGGLGKVHQLFGAELGKVIEELNRELAA